MTYRPAALTLTCLVAACLASASFAQEDPGSDAWIDARAGLFSQVCMAAAPDFQSVDALASAAGMQDTPDGWHLPPEVMISVLEHEGICNCFMTAGAPEPTKMVGAVFDRLMQDFGDSFTGDLQGLANVAPFQRDGIEVVSILETREVDGNEWIAARLSVAGACAGPEGES